MIESAPTPGLRRFTCLAAMATLALICVGGLVTSHGVGMAVPDWPNTYGYNMFFFPVSRWIGGIFYEHSHRLVASAVGLLTTVLAIWFFGKPARPFLRWGGLLFYALGWFFALVAPARWRDDLVLVAAGLASFTASFFWPNSRPAKKWMRVLGIIAFGAVVLQGVLGGLRVTLYRDEIGIFHAALAQLFFVLLAAIALFNSDWWNRLPRSPTPDRGRLRVFYVLLGALILTQLVLGATMRHQHAGLAIPDFPAAYGRLWPGMDAQSIEAYNQRRIELANYKPITAFQVGLQMTHRIVALIILVAVISGFWKTRRGMGSKHLLTKLCALLLVGVGLQVLLGAATIWSGKSADIGTAHVAVGALVLMLASSISIVSFRLLHSPRERRVSDAPKIDDGCPSSAPTSLATR